MWWLNIQHWIVEDNILVLYQLLLNFGLKVAPGRRNKNAIWVHLFGIMKLKIAIVDLITAKNRSRIDHQQHTPFLPLAI